MIFFSIPSDQQDNIAYLFKKYSKQLLYFISRIISDPKLQEDALQESFYIVSKNYNKIKELDSTETRNYIYMIVKTTSLKIYNKEKRNQNNLELKENILNFNQDELSIDKYIINADLQLLLRYALSELNDTERNLIIMRYYLEFSIKEISELLSIKENTVSQKIIRAKHKLAKIIIETEVKNSHEQKR